MKMLLADDDFTSREILLAVLKKWGFEVIAASDGDQAWQALNAPDPPRLAILDWIMPGMDGIEVVRKLRTKDAAEPPYVIILTSRDEKKDISEALNAGAYEYITKPYDNGELLARLGVGLRVIKLQTALASRVRELDAANVNMAHLACTDELTGLDNRRSFNDRLSQEISAARRHGYPLALVMTDLDHFKNVNDSFGHDAGDQVLKVFSALLVDTARLEDFPARWGGEEFIILLPHTTLAGGARLAERLRKRFAQAPCQGVNLSLSASFGVAELLNGESGEGLIRRADSALMRAKQEGRNRVVIAPQNTETLPGGAGGADCCAERNHSQQ
jgi:two-component system cell cycle response regulator